MHFNMPLISVIIPAYNHENYVQETINSIINQTYQNIELIIIDDGSTDSTWQKIQEMKIECEKRFSKIYFETKTNEGIALTLNKLLAQTTGDYIYLIASDDLAKPNAIEKQVEFLEKNLEYSLVVGDNEIIDSKGVICYWDKNRNNVYDEKKANFKTFSEFLQKERNLDFSSDAFGTYKTLSIGNYIPNGYMIRKAIFEKIGNYTIEAPLEDWWLMLQISKYSKMKYLAETLFSYRWHEANTIKQIEKIELLEAQTREYEAKILNNINENEVFEEVVQTKNNGACYKKQGIPYIFEILSYKKINNKKHKTIKLFNITIKKKEIKNAI